MELLNKFKGFNIFKESYQNKFVSRLLAMSFLIKLCFAANAQNFQFRTYSFNNGLSSYNASKILQDKFGFIWICTQEGLNRFDGRDFIAIKKDPIRNNGLSENYITDAAIDKTGKIWVASALGGIDVMNPENFVIEKRLQANPLKENSLMTNWIRSLAWSVQQELWIGTYYGFNIYNSRTDSFISVTENPFHKNHDLNISFSVTDSLNNMWLIAENDGVLIYNTITKKIINSISKEEFGISPEGVFNVRSIFIDGPNSIYLCSGNGLKHVVFKNQQYVPEPIENRLLSSIPASDIRGIIKDNNNRLWVGTEKGILIYDKTSKPGEIKHSNFYYNTILDDNINYLFKDCFGSIWVTTTKGLNLLINDQFHFQAFNSKSGIFSEMKHINTLYADNDKTIYACAVTGLYKINIENLSATRVLNNSRFGKIEAVVRINQNGFLASAAQKLVYIEKRNNHFKSFDATVFFEELKSIQFNLFSTYLKLNDSIILMGSMQDEGLIKWDFKNHILKQFKSKGGDKHSLSENNIHNIKKDRAGNVWLLCNSSITMYDAMRDVFTNYVPFINPDKKNCPHFFFDLYDDGRYLWITSYGYGLIRFDRRNNSYTANTEKNGFSSNATYNILNENDSIVWVSSNKGLTRFNTHSGKAIAYYFNDGLQSDAFDERSACKSNNYLFFGGIDGFTQISRNKLFTHQGQIPVYIGKINFTSPAGEAVEVNSLNISNTSLKFKSMPITFHILSPDYRNSYRNNYAFKIEEISDRWIETGKKKELTLAGLSPGVYHIRGRIYSTDGYANESGKLQFIIIAQWYQTMLFKICVALLIVLILYAFYRYRVRQLKKQQQIRRDIASDLHDDIGSTLNSVKIYARLVEISPNKKENIDRIMESLKQATTGLRDLIWVLDDQQDTGQDLVNRIKQFAIPLTDSSNVDINFIVDGDSHLVLKKTEKRNLLLISKEAINNSIKYAECKKIEITLQQKNRKTVLIIEDDGCGFDHDKITPGYGLKNISYRAKQIKYVAKVYSEKNKGTRIIISTKN